MVWFKLVCAVCCARAGLVKQHITVSNAVAFLNMLGVATPFGLVCLVSVFTRSGLLVRSWSRLSGRFCPCWSGGVRTVLVWSPWYTWSGLIASVLFCVAHLVCIGLVEAALFQAGVLSLSSVLSGSLCSVLVWSQWVDFEKMFITCCVLFSMFICFFGKNGFVHIL